MYLHVCGCYNVLPSCIYFLCSFLLLHILSAERISWFDLVMFSELVISLLPNEDKFHDHLLQYSDVFSGMCMAT